MPAMMRVLLLVVAATATNINMQLRGGDVHDFLGGGAAPAPAGAGGPGPAPSPCGDPEGPCCEEEKLKAELDTLKAHDSDGNSADGGVGTKEYMKKYHAA